MRTVIDEVSKVPGSTQLQVELCQEMVAWTRQEKRTFLRQRVEARLAALYLELKEYRQALTIITSLVSNVSLVACGSWNGPEYLVRRVW